MTQLKVAAYCRVSTKKEEQEKSLENQQKYFTEIIGTTPSWQFHAIYSDEESGTSTKKRKGFLQMMADARAHSFDLILTKEISRFARNVQDSIKYTEELKRLGIEVRFLTDSINSFDPDHELRFNLMSSIYQDESRRTSQRVRWGHQRQMENGVVFGASVYGYHLKGGKLTINEKEAQVIRLIFNLYLEDGMGAHKIAKALENKGILSPTGSFAWKSATILRMLKNEKYMGMLKQKKQITIDYKTHQRKTNNGEEEFIVIENSHEAIIPPETWQALQQEIASRRTKIINKTNHSNRYWLSGKIQCEDCKSTYKRKKISRGRYQYIVWVCAKASKEGKEKVNDAGLAVGCNSKTIHERLLQDAFTATLRTVITDASNIADVSNNADKANNHSKADKAGNHNKIKITDIVASIKSILHEVLSNTDDNTMETNRIESEIRRNENRISRLVELFLDGGIDRNRYNTQRDSLVRQTTVLYNDLSSYVKIKDEAEPIADKLESISTIVESILAFNDFSEELAKALVHKIIVKDRKQITCCFHTT